MVDAVQQIASALKPNTVQESTPVGTNPAIQKSTSPSRLIDSRSKCYQQLVELKNLKECFQKMSMLNEREAIY